MPQHLFPDIYPLLGNEFPFVDYRLLVVGGYERFPGRPASDGAG